MTIPRAKLIHPDVSLWYHCMSTCVRGAFLLRDDNREARKRWIEERMEFLSGIFALSVGSYAILDNHLHLVLGLQPKRLAELSDEEILDRWYMLYPPKGSNRKVLTDEKLQKRREEDLQDAELMAKLRQRIGSISWFCKLLKEPLSRMINKEEGRRGTFFEGRFKSIAIDGPEALLSTSVYVDLNVVAAGKAATPETSLFTSIKARLDHVKRLRRLDDLAAAQQGSVAAALLGEGLNDGLWLAPIGEQLPQGVSRDCFLEMPLGQYVLLVEYSGRLVREGKASISADIAGVFERLGTSAEVWQERLRCLTTNRLTGRFLASTRQGLEEGARRLGLSRLRNLAGAPVR